MPDTSSLVPTSSQLVRDEPEGPRPLVPSYRDEDEGRTPGSPTDQNHRDEPTDPLAALRQASATRLRAAVEKTIRDREHRAEVRRQFAERRRHGLRARHAAKLARRRPDAEGRP